MLPLLFRNEEGIGGGEAEDYMFPRCHLPCLRIREGDGTQQRKSRHQLDTFPMKGQGPAQRATRQDNSPLVFASELTSGPCGAGAKRPAGWEAELEEPPAATDGAVLCPGAAPTCISPAISGSISTKGLTSVEGARLLPQVSSRNWDGPELLQADLGCLGSGWGIRRSQGRAEGPRLLG